MEIVLKPPAFTFSRMSLHSSGTGMRPDIHLKILSIKRVDSIRTVVKLATPEKKTFAIDHRTIVIPLDRFGKAIVMQRPLCSILGPCY